MPLARHGVFIWPTWITGLLSGDRHCRFAAWYRARFKYQKRQDPTFDSAGWSAKHTVAVFNRKEQLEADGWTVAVEGQNDFKLKGRTAILSGKPDIVATKPEAALIVDCKTGKKRDSDYWQVLIYILALRRVRPELKAIAGEVCYPDQSIRIEPEELTPMREEQIFAVLRLVGGDERPAHVPSRFECGFCDVAECTERWTEPVRVPETISAEF